MSLNVNKTNQIGLIAAVILVASNMLGSGIYMLPAILANVGSISIIAWGITLIGIFALALVFAKLALLVPSGSGIYAYVKEAFGNFTGFQINFIYSIANWVALVSLLIVVTGYLGKIFPIFNQQSIATLTQLIIIWIFIFLNLCGARYVGIVQSITFIFGLIPILFVAIFGWKWFSINTFIQSWQVAHVSSASAINMCFNTIIWSFIGIESACVVSKVISNPKRNVPLATIFGVSLGAAICMSTCTVMMGVIPNQVLAKSNAPFADFLVTIFNFKYLMFFLCIIAITNCCGAISGWILVTVQTIKAASEDNLFPNFLAKTNKNGIPSRALLLIGIVMSIIVILTSSPNAQTQFNKIINISVILYLIPYICSAFAIIQIGKNRIIPKSQYISYVILGIISGLFCIWSIINADLSVSLSAFILTLISMIFYSDKPTIAIKTN